MDDEVQLNCENQSSSIDPLIILVPVGIFVLPPLLFSVLVLIFWKKSLRKPNVTSRENENNTKQEPPAQKRFSEFYDVDEAGDSFLTDI